MKGNTTHTEPQLYAIHFRIKTEAMPYKYSTAKKTWTRKNINFSHSIVLLHQMQFWTWKPIKILSWWMILKTEFGRTLAFFGHLAI